MSLHGAVLDSLRWCFQMMPMAFVLAGLVWFVGIVVLRLVTARMAARAGRGDFFALLRDVGWLLEKERPWTVLGRFTLAWMLGGPFAIVGILYAMAFFVGHRS